MRVEFKLAIEAIVYENVWSVIAIRHVIIFLLNFYCLISTARQATLPV